MPRAGSALLKHSVIQCEASIYEIERLGVSQPFVNLTNYLKKDRDGSLTTSANW